MKAKLKKILIPFILMIIFNLSIYSAFNLNFGEGLHPHVGIIFISGLLFGPFGALGASIGNLICDLVRGYPLITALFSCIVTFGVSLFAYKVWYEPFRLRPEVTKPRLNNISNFILFLAIINVSASIYAILHQMIIPILHPNINNLIYIIGLRYWLNFINSSFIIGIIGIWLSRKIDFVDVPKKSEPPINKKFYTILGALIILSLTIVALTNYIYKFNPQIHIGETILITVLLYAYLTKPNLYELKEVKSHSTSEGIMNIFLLITIIIIIFGYLIGGNMDLINSVANILHLGIYEIEINIMLFIDSILVFFLIPSLGVLKYIEKKVIEPINKFSQIEGFIKEGEEIKSEGLIETYAEYSNENNEIGNLARSYTELITYNNHYIENIREIEGERERIKTELYIAERIQKEFLPTETLENEKCSINGYSEPAKEVGGDFFDYYEIDDDNIAIIIGDASGKGIPAAILSAITQNLIKQLVKTTEDPSKILESLNNQFCENNQETMFITLWLGIYNKNSNIIRYSNAGHNPPLIKENGEFKKLDIDAGIAIGLLDDFKYKTEETEIKEGLVLYTDGITDANNENRELYGENRLIEFLNNSDFNGNMINDVLENINEFTGDAEQFDDITVLLLRIKNDK